MWDEFDGNALRLAAWTNAAGNERDFIYRKHTGRSKTGFGKVRLVDVFSRLSPDAKKILKL